MQRLCGGNAAGVPVAASVAGEEEGESGEGQDLRGEERTAHVGPWGPPEGLWLLL